MFGLAAGPALALRGGAGPRWSGGYGPFLAIGEPNEGLPQLGAARAYLSDDKWQEQVRALDRPV